MTFKGTGTVAIKEWCPLLGSWRRRQYMYGVCMHQENLNNGEKSQNMQHQARHFSHLGHDSQEPSY